MENSAEPPCLLCGGHDGTILFREAGRAGLRPQGIELNPRLVAHVREHLGIPCVEGALEEVSLGEGSFDVVCHVDLLSHL